MSGLRRRSVIFLFVFLPLLFCAAVAGANTRTQPVGFIWNIAGERIRIVSVETREGQVLFLPGACDGHLIAGGDRGMQWNDTAVAPGSELDVSAWIGKTVEVQVDHQRFPLKIMRGSAISSLFFTLTEEDWTRVSKNRQLDIRQEASLVMVNARGGKEVSDTLTSFHLHGNSTVFGQKKPFQFKLSARESLDGMGKGKTWMLLANWFDISLIRNQMTFDLCRELGLAGTPDCTQTDVYVNGAYLGTYLLTEKIQLKKGRLDITNMEDALEQLNPDIASAKRQGSSRHATHVLKYFDVKEPEDITGGFLLEIEKALHFTQNEEDAGFVTDGKMCVVIKEPSQPGLEAANYIAALVNDFHNAVLSGNGVNPATGKAYTAYMDMHSFAAKILVEEFSANYDVRAGSQFMYKDSDKVDPLLHAGPGWDYDLTYGNKEDGLRNPRKRDYVYNRSNATSQLYHYLLTHADFRAYARQLLDRELVPAAEILLGRRPAPEGSALKSIRTYLNSIRDSAAMNFTLWNPRLVGDITDESGRTFEDAGAYLKDWVEQRFEMMQAEWLLN